AQRAMRCANKAAKRLHDKWGGHVVTSNRPAGTTQQQKNLRTYASNLTTWIIVSNDLADFTLAGYIANQTRCDYSASPLVRYVHSGQHGDFRCCANFRPPDRERSRTRSVRAASETPSNRRESSQESAIWSLPSPLCSGQMRFPWWRMGSASQVR